VSNDVRMVRCFIKRKLNNPARSVESNDTLTAPILRTAQIASPKIYETRRKVSGVISHSCLRFLGKPDIQSISPRLEASKGSVYSESGASPYFSSAKHWLRATFFPMTLSGFLSLKVEFRNIGMS
jgi:hypothetical protein